MNMKHLLFSIDVYDLPEGVSDLAELEDLPKEAGFPGKIEDTCLIKVREDHGETIEKYLNGKNIKFTVEEYFT